MSFTAGDVTPKLVAGSEGCLTNPESGYEECRLEVPLTKWDGKTYQSVETQSWEITGVVSPTPNQRIYQYKWMTGGAGAASQISTSSTWKSTWSIEGEGSGHVQVSLAQTPSGQTVQQAKKTDSAIDDSDAIKITEVKTEGGRSQITVHDPSTWWIPSTPVHHAAAAATHPGFCRIAAHWMGFRPNARRQDSDRDHYVPLELARRALNGRKHIIPVPTQEDRQVFIGCLGRTSRPDVHFCDAQVETDVAVRG